MSELQNELDELKQFVAELKADRAETKAKERRDAWTKYVSLSLVIIAVTAAIAAQWSGKYGSRTQMSQAQASDQWSFYQAKSIKQHLTEAAHRQLARTANPGDATVAAESKKLEEQIARYDKEKAEIKTHAENLEKSRDEASRRGGKMGLAVSLLSVAIATGSICTVTKKKPLWFVSLALAAGGLMEMLLAWLN